MFRDRGGAFRVAVGPGVVVHMIAQLITEPDGLGVIMIVVPGLMGEGWVKGNTFVVIAIAVPDPVAGQPIDGSGIGAAGTGIGKGITAVEHGDAVDHGSGGPETRQAFGGRNDRGPRDAIGFGGVGGEIGKVLGLGRIEIPRPHQMAGESAGADVNPVAGKDDFADARVGGTALHTGATAPGGHGSTGCFGGGGFVDPGVLAGTPGVP